MSEPEIERNDESPVMGKDEFLRLIRDPDCEIVGVIWFMPGYVMTFDLDRDELQQQLAIMSGGGDRETFESIGVFAHYEPERKTLYVGKEPQS